MFFGRTRARNELRELLARQAAQGSAFVLVRYNANGSLDATFGTGGQVTTSFGRNAEATAVAIQSDGAIVVAGHDAEGAAFALLGALLTTNSEGTEEYRWVLKTAQTLPDDGMRADVLLKLERAKKRWSGELVEGD